jgi:hypothetical protein
MLPFLGLLFALRVGTVPAQVEPAAFISVRAEARAVAAEMTSSMLDGTAPSAAVPRAPAWPVAQGGPAIGPVLSAYHPSEWVQIMAHRLNVHDSGIVHAAMWLSTWPLQVDVTPRRVHVTLHFRAP